MEYSIKIENWHAIAPGLNTKEQWEEWVDFDRYELTGEINSSQKTPMMTARRMSVPSRLAVDVALVLMDERLDAAIFISRHGELERTYKIVDSLVKIQDVSPTDFAMSVHNTAAGLLTIVAKQTLPITSLSAGLDGFHQGMLEAQAMLSSGASRVLLVDFDSLVPSAYQESFESKIPVYAVGMILSKGDKLCCKTVALGNRVDQYPNIELKQFDWHSKSFDTVVIREIEMFNHHEESFSDNSLMDTQSLRGHY